MSLFPVLATIAVILLAAIPSIWLAVSYWRSGDEFEDRIRHQYERERRILDRAGPIYPLH